MQVIEAKEFEMNKTYITTDIFTGAKHCYAPIARETKTKNTITFEVTQHELDGIHKTTRELEVYANINDMIEYVIIWEYCGHKGYLYATEPNIETWED